MVLAAGRGQRMRPLSDAMPKPALPLPNGPVVAWPLRLAARAGAHRIVVNACHLAERMERALEQARPAGVDIVVSREARLMGTAGGLALAHHRDLLTGEGPVLVVNGDSVMSLDLEPLLGHHLRCGRAVTLALVPNPDPSRWSRVHLDGDGRITEIVAPGQPAPGEAPLLYPGVMVVSRAALERLPVATGGVPELLWEPARRAGELGGEVVAGDWREVGTPADYLRMALSQVGRPATVHPTAKVAGSATLERAFVGIGARIDRGAVVTGSVVADGAAVGAGARVTGSVLLGGVTAAPGEVLVDAFLAGRPTP